MDFSKSHIDFVGRAKTWYMISIVITTIGFFALVYRTIESGFPLNRGIDFIGGSIIQLQFDNWNDEINPVNFAAEVEALVASYTEKAPSVQTSLVPDEATGQKNLILNIRADSSLIDHKESQTEAFNKIREIGGEFRILEQNQVGALMGRELTNKAILGVIIGNALILLYIAFRFGFSFDFGIIAIIGVLHDFIIVTGVFALFNLEINSSFVAVLLTVVGYSVMDTIIIYDRIRENMQIKRHLSFDKLVNVSLNETLARSINTTVTTVLAILALLIFGGVSIRTFMTGLAIGITCGAYSSIFLVAPLLVTWRIRKMARVVDVAEIPVRRTADIIRESDEDLINLGPDGDEGSIEAITVGTSKTGQAARKRPKRRRRRQ